MYDNTTRYNSSTKFILRINFLPLFSNVARQKCFIEIFFASCSRNPRDDSLVLKIVRFWFRCSLLAFFCFCLHIVQRMDLTTRRTAAEGAENFPNDGVNSNSNSNNNNNNNNNNNGSSANKAKLSKSIFSIRSIMDVDDDHQSTETINHNLQGEFLFLISFHQ